MSRTPQRRGERKFIATGSIWTNGSTDVVVIEVKSYGDYKYVTYRFTHKRKPEPQPLDDMTFALRYDAKTVRKDEIKAEAQVIKRDLEDGKVKNVTWA